MLLFWPLTLPLKGNKRWWISMKGTGGISCYLLPFGCNLFNPGFPLKILFKHIFWHMYWDLSQIMYLLFQTSSVSFYIQNISPKFRLKHWDFLINISIFKKYIYVKTIFVIFFTQQWLGEIKQVGKGVLNLISPQWNLFYFIWANVWRKYCIKNKVINCFEKHTVSQNIAYKKKI